MDTTNQQQLALKIEQLTLVKNRFGEHFVAEKIKLLNEIASVKLDKVNAIIKYHDCLLFLIAYPENELLIKIAQAESRRVNEALKNKTALRSQTVQRQLFFSGMNYSAMICSFSFDLVKWLYSQYPEQVEFYSSDATSDKQQEVMRIIMPHTQQQLIDEGNKLSFAKWMSLSIGSKKSNCLSWLINRFDGINDATMRDILFASLKIFVSITLNEKMYSRTSGIVLPNTIFYHSDLFKGSKFIFSNELLKVRRLSLKEKEQLIAIARMSLCCLQRETNPVTYAEPNATECYEMDRGISIALFTMKASRRLTLESYIGYMTFKNGVPVAYGGGWIYNRQAKIGINVYEAFRGGESAFLFSEIMRLYAARFGVTRFVAEPYQIGKHNSDGIKSGAFWFYYKLGFRPVQNYFSALAQVEFDKLTANNNYRTPTATLNKLALSNMQLAENSNNTVSYLELSNLSLAQLKNEAGQFKSWNTNTEKTEFDFLIKTLAIKDFKSWPFDEQQSFKRLIGFMVMIEELQKWSKKDKSSLVKLMRSKGSQSESAFIKMVQLHKKLTDSLLKLARS